MWPSGAADVPSSRAIERINERVSKLDTLGDVSALCEALEGAAATDGR